MKNKRVLLYIARGAVTSALYVALTLAFAPISFGAVQFRISEALMVLPMFFPESVWALTLGCLISNFASSFGWIDIVFGTLATLLACLYCSLIKNKYLAPIPAVLFNGVIVGAVITYFEADGLSLAAFLKVFAFNALTVGLGEAVVCWGLGVPLAIALQKNKLFNIKNTPGE